MTAGYWACRINRYGHLWGGKTYSGYWWYDSSIWTKWFNRKCKN
jgi:hypothetical protein